MKIDLRKPPKERKEFCIEYKNGEDFAVFSGFFSFKLPFLIIDGEIKGKISVVCDVSGEPFTDEMIEEIKIKAVEGEHKGFDEEYDIVELEAPVFDFESFLKDEIELFRGGYHKKTELDEALIEI